MKTEKTDTPFADAAISGPARLSDHVAEGDYTRMSDLEGHECILLSAVFDTHPEYGDSYRCVVCLASDLEAHMVCHLRGTVVMRKLQEALSKCGTPLAFKLIKPEGKRYWDFA